jgi:excisionase family DNA binding protein
MGLPLLSVRQVAERLGVCTATVYALCARGALPHVRVLNAIRLAPVDLEEFVEARRRKGTGPPTSLIQRQSSTGGLRSDPSGLSARPGGALHLLCDQRT